MWNDLQTETKSYIIIAEFKHIINIALIQIQSVFEMYIILQAKEFQMSER